MCCEAPGSVAGGQGKCARAFRVRLPMAGTDVHAAPLPASLISFTLDQAEDRGTFRQTCLQPRRYGLSTAALAPPRTSPQSLVPDIPIPRPTPVPPRSLQSAELHQQHSTQRACCTRAPRAPQRRLRRSFQYPELRVPMTSADATVQRVRRRACGVNPPRTVVPHLRATSCVPHHACR